MPDFHNKKTAARYEMTGAHGRKKIITPHWEGYLEDAPPEVVTRMLTSRSALVREKSKPAEKAEKKEAPADKK